MIQSIAALARFMYEREMTKAGMGPHKMKSTWESNSAVREHWFTEAEVVVNFLMGA